MVRLICLLIGYAFGLIQTGYIVGRLHHQDIRQLGSGNAGSTNALRVYGAKAGVMTLLCDVLKAVAAVLLVRILFVNRYPDFVMLLEMYAGAGVILGHNFPFYLGFRGGKGVAASLGLAIVFDWRLVIVIAIVFLGIVFTTRYVSLGSLCSYVAVYISIIIFGQRGTYSINPKYLPELYILFGALTALAFYKHRENIKRLIAGTENKFGAGKAKQ